MVFDGNLPRRAVLTGGAAVAAAAVTSACSAQTPSGETAVSAASAIPPATIIQRAGADSAVLFLSRSGNTRVLATAIARRSNADLIEIRPREAWPEEYQEMVEWASRWKDSATPLPLAQDYDLTQYRRIYLGFPVWGTSLPAPMRSLLAAANLSGKIITPIITHGNYGPGDVMEVLRARARGATIEEAFILPCPQERTTLEKLDAWLA